MRVLLLTLVMLTSAPQAINICSSSVQPLATAAKTQLSPFYVQWKEKAKYMINVVVQLRSNQNWHVWYMSITNVEILLKVFICLLALETIIAIPRHYLVIGLSPTLVWMHCTNVYVCLFACCLRPTTFQWKFQMNVIDEDWMFTCIAAQVPNCKGLLPDCSVGIKLRAKMTEVECVGSMHSNFWICLCYEADVWLCDKVG